MSNGSIFFVECQSARQRGFVKTMVKENVERNTLLEQSVCSLVKTKTHIRVSAHLSIVTCAGRLDRVESSLH